MVQKKITNLWHWKFPSGLMVTYLIFQDSKVWLPVLVKTPSHFWMISSENLLVKYVNRKCYGYAHLNQNCSSQTLVTPGLRQNFVRSHQPQPAVCHWTHLVEGFFWCFPMICVSNTIPKSFFWVNTQISPGLASNYLEAMNWSRYLSNFCPFSWFSIASCWLLSSPGCFRNCISDDSNLWTQVLYFHTNEQNGYHPRYAWNKQMVSPFLSLNPAVQLFDQCHGFPLYEPTGKRNTLPWKHVVNNFGLIPKEDKRRE